MRIAPASADCLRDILEERLVLLDPFAVARLPGVKVANDVIPDHRPVRLLDIEVENAGLSVIDPYDGVKMFRPSAVSWQGLAVDPTAPRQGCAMTRFMRNNAKAATVAAAPGKAASYEIGEDEAGMRLDRWLHRRFPEVSNSAPDADRAQGRGARLGQAGGRFDPA